MPKISKSPKLPPPPQDPEEFVSPDGEMELEMGTGDDGMEDRSTFMDNNVPVGADWLREQLGSSGVNDPRNFDRPTKLDDNLASAPIMASTEEGAVQWLVEKRNDDTGLAEYLAEIPITLSMRVFIRRFIQAMPREGEPSAEFYFTPLDSLGSKMGMKPSGKKNIPWNSPTLLDIRAALAAANPISTGGGNDLLIGFLQAQATESKEERRLLLLRLDETQKAVAKAAEEAVKVKLDHAAGVQTELSSAYQAVGQVQREQLTAVLKTREEFAKDDRDRAAQMEAAKDAERKSELAQRKLEAEERVAALKAEADAKLASIKAETDAKLAATKAETEARLAMQKAEAEARFQREREEAQTRRAEIQADIEKARASAELERQRWEKDREREDQRRADERKRDEDRRADEHKRDEDRRAEEQARRDKMEATERERIREEQVRRDALALTERNLREKAEFADRERMREEQARRDKMDSEEKERQRDHAKYLENIRQESMKAERERLVAESERLRLSSESEEKRRQEHHTLVLSMLRGEKQQDKFGIFGEVMNALGLTPMEAIDKVKGLLGSGGDSIGTSVVKGLFDVVKEGIKLANNSNFDNEEEEEGEVTQLPSPAPRALPLSRPTAPGPDLDAFVKKPVPPKAETVTPQVQPEPPVEVVVETIAPEIVEVVSEDILGRRAVAAMIERIEAAGSEGSWGAAIMDGSDVDAAVRYMEQVGVGAALEGHGVDIARVEETLIELGLIQARKE